MSLCREPGLSIVVFERTGWDAAQYQAWTEAAMAEGLAFVVPSRYQGRPVFRFCFVNPKTTEADIERILSSMADDLPPVATPAD